ncbi:MAG: SDR family oxidoreductase [Fidelibacterota bacterium]
MEGKICVITGSTNGIGKVAATALAGMGARIVLVSRNQTKGEQVKQEIIEQTGTEQVDFFQADLSLLKAIRRVAEIIRQQYDHIDVLLNNAGAFFSAFELTDEGFERTFALNHLNYFLLTRELLPLVQAAPRGRIVNVASDAHKGVEMDFENLNGEKNFSGWKAYQRSKLANIMFTYRLAEQLDHGSVTANCLHPGFVRTGFGDNNKGLFRAGLKMAKRLAAISMAKGAETSIYLASSPEVEGVSGKYFEKKKAVPSSKASYDQEAIRRLWDVSETLVAGGTTTP